MMDLGLMLAWSAVQASLVLATTVAIYLRASRRGPASGAWVVSLGLALALAAGLASMARWGGGASSIVAPNATTSVAAKGNSARDVAAHASGTVAEDHRPLLTFDRLREAWNRLDRTASAPAARCRQWGGLLAVVGLAGVACGMLRLLVGLWAVRLIRMRSRPVEDPELLSLLSELRAAMSCRRRVEVRASAELTAPATAGWRHAVILVPEDWRSWDDDERRAVLSHELAHILRDDYLTGIVAKAAQAVYFYHPLVHWLAARLRLEQELAADALGAQFAGGKTRYLYSLSRLALRQDGRPPCWPARAFLPVKGTLIRRIVMLRDEKETPRRPWKNQHRALAAALLLGVTVVASLMHGPARAGDLNSPAEATSKQRPAEPFDLSYVMDEDTQGFVAFRPAAAFRLAGMDIYRTLANLAIGQQWALAANRFKFDPTKPGQTAPRIEMFEQVTADIRLWRTNGPKPNGRLGLTRFTCRTAGPVDWKAVLRLFGAEVTELRDGDCNYFRVSHSPFGLDAFFFCPDERTLVLSGDELPDFAQKRLCKLLHRDRSFPPPAAVFAQGKDWDQLIRGLLVVGLDNRGGKLTKLFRDDKFPSDDVDPMPAFEHADLWAIALANDDEIRFRAVGTCPDADAGGATASAVRGLIDQGRRQAEASKPEVSLKPEQERAERMKKEFLTRMQVDRDGRSVLLQSVGIGAVADLASLFAAGVIN